MSQCDNFCLSHKGCENRTKVCHCDNFWPPCRAKKSFENDRFFGIFHDFSLQLQTSKCHSVTIYGGVTIYVFWGQKSKIRSFSDSAIFNVTVTLRWAPPMKTLAHDLVFCVRFLTDPSI